MEAAAFFAKAPPPKARGIAVIATSGGAAIMAADKAESVWRCPAATRRGRAAACSKRIFRISDRRAIPAMSPGQVVNNPHSMPACSDALLSDPAYGALVVPQTLAFEMYKARVAALASQSQQYGKITCSVLISSWLQGPGTLDAEMDPHVALFRSMDRCFRTLAAWHRIAPILQARGERTVVRVSDPAAARKPRD